MKGMLLKDLYIARQNARYLGAVMLVYLVVGFSLSNVTMTLGLTTVICVMLSFSFFSHDDMSNWDSYVHSLPVSRRDIVSARYVAGLILLGLGVLLSFVMWGVFALLGVESESTATTLAGIGGTAGAGLLLMSVLFPLCYRYGVEKARMGLVAVFLLPIALGAAAQRLGLPMPGEQTVIHILQVSGILVPLFFALSWNISYTIYAKKMD